MAKMHGKWLKTNPNTVKVEANGDVSVFINDSDAIEATTEGLKVKALGIRDSHLEGNIAFEKLADNSNIGRLDQAETVVNDWTFTNAPKTSAAPVEDDDLARKAYVDAIAQGLSPKNAVRILADAGTVLTGAQTIQGVSVEAEDRVAVQGDGIYICKTDTWVRSDDMQVGIEGAGISCFVEQGDYADRKIVVTNDKGSDIVGSDPINFAIFSSLEHLQSGNGIDKTGDIIAVDHAKLEEGGNAEVEAMNLKASFAPSNYIPTSTDLVGQFAGIDAKIAEINLVTAEAIVPVVDPVVVTTEHIAAKSLALSETPIVEPDVTIEIKDAPGQFYGDDYIVIGSDLSWNGLGLDGILEVGDKITVRYSK